MTGSRNGMRKVDGNGMCLSSSLGHCQMAHVTAELYPLLIEDINLTLPSLHECQLSVELRGCSYPLGFAAPISNCLMTSEVIRGRVKG